MAALFDKGLDLVRQPAYEQDRVCLRQHKIEASRASDDIVACLVGACTRPGCGLGCAPGLCLSCWPTVQGTEADLARGRPGETRGGRRTGVVCDSRNGSSCPALFSVALEPKAQGYDSHFAP